MKNSKDILMKFISTQGYKRNSPDVNRPLNVIPSGRITMQDVDFPVRGVDNLGNEMFMVPGGEYFFPGDYVVETPMMQRGGQTNNDREMVEGIADILTMVKDPVNRRQIAAEMVRDFKREGVKYDLQEFQKMAQVRMQRGGLTFQQYYTPAAESTGANYTPIMTVQTAEKLKAQRNAQELARRRQAIQASQAAASKPLRERLTPENLAQETGATGDKLRFFPNDPDSFIDDYLNPLKMVGDMASGLGRIPLNVKQGNYGAAALDIAIPVATGALAGLGAKSAGQFVNNLANPLAGTGQFLTTKTPLKNAYMINRWAFKPKPNMYYRQVGEPGYLNAIQENRVLAKGQKEFLEQNPEFNYWDDYDKLTGYKNKTGFFSLEKPKVAAFFQKGELFFPISNRTGFGRGKTAASDVKYLFEGNLPDEAILPRYRDKYLTREEFLGDYTGGTGVLDPKYSDLSNFKIYKKDWLRGYKEIPVATGAFPLAGTGDFAANAAARSSLFGDIKSGLQDLGHIYDQSLGYLFNNRANKRAIAEGNEWLRNWIQHPATQAKIDNDFADKINRSFVKDVYDLGYEQAKNFTPVSTELPLSVQLAKGFYPNKGNWGVSYLHGVDPMPRRMIEQGQMDAPIWHGSFISRTLDLPYEKRVGTTIHEGTHDWTSRFGLEASGQREFLERSINPEIHQDLEYWRRHGDDKTRADLGKKRRYQAYLADPTEQHARIMELRKYLGHTPDFVSTPEYAQKVMNHLSAMPRHKRPIDSEGFFKVFDNDPQKLSNMFNRLWGVTPVVVAGAAAASKKQDAQPTMQEYKLGGYISKQVGGEPDPEMMFRDKYNTLLKPEEERKFNRWAAKESKRQGRDILMDMGSYDVRGFWKSGDYKRMDQDNHGSDTWKKPNHPTFSNHSRYHGADGWYGGNWTDEGGYQPSKQTLQMYGPDYYQWMFGTEPNRPEHLDMSRYKSGINAPTPLYYKKGGQHGGLDRWFAEKWVDIKTGKECGRQEGEKRAGYPACRPSKRISEDTPKTASELSSSEKEKFKRSKTSSERISYQHKRKQDGGEWLDKYENTKKNRQKIDQLFGPPAAGNVDYVPAVESVVGGFSAGLAKSALAPVVKSSLRSLQKYMEMQENPFVKIDLPVFNEAKNWLNKYDDQVTTK